ncbi:MAG TPA: DUF433 domain-containing protein [Candidatus Wunengus sp. YC61]|uniref:DUF433 domain-containing protein n=1 Tax=Candidatus Wunengus sp. YC61 TaxID=3367698 RepID=UPI004026672B
MWRGKVNCKLINGTRIPVHIMLDLHTDGDNFDGIKKTYPNIIEEDIRACLSQIQNFECEKRFIF